LGYYHTQYQFKIHESPSAVTHLSSIVQVMQLYPRPGYNASTCQGKLHYSDRPWKSMSVSGIFDDRSNLTFFSRKKSGFANFGFLQATILSDKKKSKMRYIKSGKTFIDLIKRIIFVFRFENVFCRR